MIPSHTQQGSIDKMAVEPFRIEVTTSPFEQLPGLITIAVLLNLLNEAFIFAATTNIFWRTGPLSIFHIGCTQWFIGVLNNLFDHDPVLPIIAEVVLVDEFAAFLKISPEYHLAFIEMPKLSVRIMLQIAVALISDAKLVQM